MSEKVINSQKPLAIVMGRNYTTCLCMIRAAGMVGCDVILIQTCSKLGISRKIDRKSKYVIGYNYCPEPNRSALVDMILSYKNYREKVVLLPTDDYVASTIDLNLDVLKKDFLMPHVNNTQGEMLKIMDKFYQKSLAREVGMNVANGWICKFSNGHYEIPEGVTYPCFTKPQESYSGHLKNYLKRCNNREELETVLGYISKLSTVRKNSKAILIEEYVDIEQEYGIQGIAIEGKAIVPTIVQKDSSKAGLTATGHIFPITHFGDLQNKITSFIQKTHFTGIFDIDLYVKGGRFYFNELNTRLGAGSFALTYGIYNLPGLFIEYLLGRKDGSYNGPTEFKELSFASEKVLMEMYYDHQITMKQFRSTLDKSDILSLKFKEDQQPYKEFLKLYYILPLWRFLKKKKEKYA